MIGRYLRYNGGDHGAFSFKMAWVVGDQSIVVRYSWITGLELIMASTYYSTETSGSGCDATGGSSDEGRCSNRSGKGSGSSRWTGKNCTWNKHRGILTHIRLGVTRRELLNSEE